MFANSNKRSASTYPSLNPPTLNEILGKNIAIVENPPKPRNQDEKTKETNKS